MNILRLCEGDNLEKIMVLCATAKFCRAEARQTRMSPAQLEILLLLVSSSNVEEWRRLKLVSTVSISALTHKWI